ncbi:MAG: heme NO-binding domain-containing protein [Celeribacter sp.]|jgi:hypothetical protein
MHGLINRAIQCFVTDTYGTGLWAEISREVGLGPHGFEAMLTYDDALTHTVLRRAAEQLEKPEIALLEDLGTYLCTGPESRLRRLLRFGGDTFEEFLHSLNDLPDRARLALPDLDVPGLELTDLGDGCYWLLVRHRLPRSTPLISGALRAMADDYGALVLLEPLTGPKYMPDGAPLSEPSTQRLETIAEDASVPSRDPGGSDYAVQGEATAGHAAPGYAEADDVALSDLGPSDIGPSDAAPTPDAPGHVALPRRYVTVIEIRLLDTEFHQARGFELAGSRDRAVPRAP